MHPTLSFPCCDHKSSLYVCISIPSLQILIGLSVSLLNCGFLRVMSSSGVAGSYGSFIPSYFKEFPYYSPQWLYQFTFPPTVQEGSLFSTFSPASTVRRSFDNDHFDWCEVIPCFSFDLHFSYERHWASFHILLTICMSFLEKCLLKA